MTVKKDANEDQILFRQAMRDVLPIAAQKRKVHQDEKPQPQPQHRRRLQDQISAEKLHLSDYISDPIKAETTLSYQQYSLPKKRFKQLISGEIAYEATLDLHGFRGDEAKQEMIDFLSMAVNSGKRCVLIIHGKGNYGGEPPKIKNLVNVWLPQHQQVIAFHSAIPRHGGTGALYVLLKR